jgi:hypothetical protein
VVPSGYEFGWAEIWVDGDLEPTVGDSPTVALQLAGDDGEATVWFFDVVAAAAVVRRRPRARV